MCEHLLDAITKTQHIPLGSFIGVTFVASPMDAFATSLHATITIAVGTAAWFAILWRLVFRRNITVAKIMVRVVVAPWFMCHGCDPQAVVNLSCAALA